MIEQPLEIVTLTIDNKPVGARYDETILQVATENNIYIPTLCYVEGLTEWGACRLCLVEIEGSPKLHASCVTQVQEGMVVTTNSERLQHYRKKILELLLSERNHVCSVCEVNGNCELQALAERLGVDHVHYPYRYPKFKVDATHERFVADNNRCILCMRCVRVCDEIEGAHTLDVMGRGIASRVITDLDQSWGESESCTRCGKCATVCPTGAIIERGRPINDRAARRQLLPYLTMMRKEKL